MVTYTSIATVGTVSAVNVSLPAACAVHWIPAPLYAVMLAAAGIGRISCAVSSATTSATDTVCCFVELSQPATVSDTLCALVLSAVSCSGVA